MILSCNASSGYLDPGTAINKAERGESDFNRTISSQFVVVVYEHLGTEEDKIKKVA